jgi:hypothetical protein
MNYYYYSEYNAVTEYCRILKQEHKLVFLFLISTAEILFANIFKNNYIKH